MSDRAGAAATLAPSLDELTALAEQAFARLPPAFRRAAGDVVIHVQDFADEDLLEELGIEDPFELTGLYSGVDLSRRSVLNLPGEPSRVFLYRRPILDEWVENGEITLADLVQHVLVHEIGHHLGLSDPDIEAIEASD